MREKPKIICLLSLLVLVMPNALGCSSVPAVEDRDQSVLDVKRQTKRRPSDIFQSLQEIGFHTEVSWKQSSFGADWIGQSRKWFGPDDFSANEAEIGITSENEYGPFEVSIEAEIYTIENGERATIDAAIEAIYIVWPDIPQEIVRSFSRRKPVQMGAWSIEIHENISNGYVIDLDGPLPALD